MSVVFAIGTLVKSDKTSKLTVAFENVQPMITNVRNTFERLVAEQLTIKATGKENYNRKDAPTLSQAWIPLLSRLLALLWLSILSFHVFFLMLFNK